MFLASKLNIDISFVGARALRFKTAILTVDILAVTANFHFQHHFLVVKAPIFPNKISMFKLTIEEHVEM